MNQLQKAGLSIPSEAINGALAGYAENTRKTYSMHIRRFLEWCQENGRYRFDAILVMEYIAWLKDGSGASSVNQSLAIIKGIAEKLWMARLIDRDELERIKAVKGATVEKTTVGTWLTAEQIGLIYDSINTMPRSEAARIRDRLLFGLLVGCGLRVSEAIGLTHSNLSTFDGLPSVNVMMSKGNKSRPVVMTEIARQATLEWLAYSGNVTGKLVRHVAKGGNIQAGGISTRAAMNIINGIVSHAHDTVPQIAAVPSLKDGLETHNLRRSYAVILHRNGVPVTTIQKLMGHASVEQTRVYLGDVDEITAHIASIRILG